MPLATDRSTTANVPPPPAAAPPLSGRRLISRIASPLNPKSRAPTDFYIELIHPHKQYRPGETVSGLVRLRIVKPTRVTHLVVCLHGFVQVYKNPGAPPSDGHRAHSGYVGTGRGKKAGEYFGNGFASLFEDEAVLSGDGRMYGDYRFEFNLEFPDSSLPSSIDFERGTISYMISATLTRPTAISPTIHCDHKVYLVEQIDVSNLFPPKPRTITLEPVARRARTRAPARRIKPSSESDTAPPSAITSGPLRRESGASSSFSLRADADRRQSPAPSDVSFESLESSLGPVSQQDLGAVARRIHETGNLHSSTASLASKTITATVEPLKGGCLPGDSIPIKININHTKHVKSLNGIIITMYRQARVDMHPSIPLGPTEKGTDTQREDYYPRSFTGLGGLSLSGAGSSHVFRKDLSQAILPLIVDPKTLLVEINGKVRVPDEAFPTIATVPGAIISFKYYVEVVLDVQGRLSGMDRAFSNRAGLVGSPHQPQGVEGMERDRSFSNLHGPPIVDTASIRRDRGVVACTFELVVGTKDSSRRKGKGRASETAEHGDGAELHAQARPSGHGRPTLDTTSAYSTARASTPSNRTYRAGDDGPRHGSSQLPGSQAHGESDHGEYDHGERVPEYGVDQGHYDLQPPVPMPQIEDESLLSDKERMRRAEERLLPSAPPDPETPAIDGENEPSAPYLDEDVSSSHLSRQEALPGTMRVAPVGAWDPEPNSAPGGYVQTPTYEPPREASTAGRAMTAGDDKNELQRQELELQASAPPEDENPVLSAIDDHAPTAPVLEEEEDEYYSLASEGHGPVASPPRYEQ